MTNNLTVQPDKADPKTLSNESLFVHAGNHVRTDAQPIRTPIIMANSYHLPEDPSSVDWSEADSLIYARNAGINQLGLQGKIAALEGAEDAAVFSTGVAAVHSVLFANLNSGDHAVVSSVVYEAVWRLFTDLLPVKYGIEATFVDISNLDEVRAAVRPNTKLIHTETIANPSTRIADVAALSEIAKEAGALLSVDSTFTPPPFFRPLEHGADLVIHSLSKYINGHGDALGGAVAGSTELLYPIKADALVDVGGALSPFNAWLITRGSVTLQMRYQRHVENAIAVADFLNSDPRVAYVTYPGLESHPQHELAKRQFGENSYGAMMAFAVEGDPGTQNRFVSNLKMITSAVSLGHDESLIVHSGVDGRRGYEKFPDEFKKYGHLRFSVGLENKDDIIADLQTALDLTLAR